MARPLCLSIACLLIMLGMAPSTSRGETFRRTHRIVPTNSEPGDFFGGAIDLLVDGRDITLAARSRNAYPDTRDSQIHVFQTLSSILFNDWNEVANSTFSHPLQISVGQDVAVQPTPNSPTRFPTVLVGLNQNSVNGVTSNGVVTTYTAAENRDRFEWTRQGDIFPSDLSFDAAYGRSIAVDGNRHIAGAANSVTGLEPEGELPFGAAFIVERQENGAWIELAKLATPDLTQPMAPFLNPRFGTSVDISGDTALVGAFADDDQGSAFIFREDEMGVWNQMQKLTVPDDSAFGVTVALSGDTAAVLAAESAQLYVFQEDAMGAWNLADTISGGEGAEVWASRSVALEDDLLAVSFHDQSSGWVDVYRRDEQDQWVFQQQLTSLNHEEQNYFGFNITLDGNLLAVADPGSDPVFDFEGGIPNEGPGSVEVFRLGAEIPADINGNGLVDHLDYNLWRNTYGATTILHADLSGNGVVDAADYTIWRDALAGQDSPGGGLPGVPEPASSLMAIVALAICCGRSPRRRAVNPMQ